MKPPSIVDLNRRILVVDDNRAIHEDLRKILVGEFRAGSDLQDDESLLFDVTPVEISEFELDSAYQGHEALAMLERSIADGRPYALAFVDVRMPPGWDGVTSSVTWPLATVWVPVPYQTVPVQRNADSAAFSKSS